MTKDKYLPNVNIKNEKNNLKVEISNESVKFQKLFGPIDHRRLAVWIPHII